MRGYKAAGVLTAAVLFIVGCGGGGDTNKPPSDQDLQKIAPAMTNVLNYCLNKVGGQAVGVGDVADDVDTLVSEYKAHPTVKFRLVPGGPKTSMHAILRSSESALDTSGCAPDQAKKIDDALAG